jgi:hypothetical protein
MSLKGPGSEEWSDEFEREKLVCEDYWNTAGFMGVDPFTSDKYEDYITENATRSVRVE